MLKSGSTEAVLLCAETGFLANVRSLIAGLVTKLGFGIPISDGVPSDGQKIKDTYWHHHNELAALETREAELKKQLSQDYGQNGEFVTLRDRCGVTCRESSWVPLQSKICFMLMRKHSSCWASSQNYRQAQTTGSTASTAYCFSTPEDRTGTPSLVCIKLGTLLGHTDVRRRCMRSDHHSKGALATWSRCFTADVDKYVYEICPYGDAAQKEGASRTNLGSWKGFQESYSFMSFSGGQICWNGPQRSMRVGLAASRTCICTTLLCHIPCRLGFLNISLV